MGQLLSVGGNIKKKFGNSYCQETRERQCGDGIAHLVWVLVLSIVSCGIAGKFLSFSN